MTSRSKSVQLVRDSEYDMLAIGQLERNLPPSDLRTDAPALQPGLLGQFPDDGLLHRFAVLDAAPRRCPEVLTGKRSGPVHETKQQEPSGVVHDEKPGGQSRAHRQV